MDNLTLTEPVHKETVQYLQVLPYKFSERTICAGIHHKSTYKGQPVR